MFAFDGHCTSMATSSSSAETGDIPATPHQPMVFKFPKRMYGREKPVERSFQPSWFTKWPYLHYNEAKDLVYCHTCLRAFAEKRIKAANADAAFVSVLANHEIK